MSKYSIDYKGSIQSVPSEGLEECLFGKAVNILFWMFKTTSYRSL